MWNPETVRKANTFLRKYAMFPPVDIQDPHYAEHHLILDDNEIVGFGMLKLIGEAIMVVDPHLSPLARAKVIEELGITCTYKGQMRGLDEIHAFLTGPDSVSLAKLLKRHFGFEDILGVPLVMRLRNGKRSDASLTVHGPTELRPCEPAGATDAKLSLGAAAGGDDSSSGHV